jgi:hypothetical protein
MKAESCETPTNGLHRCRDFSEPETGRRLCKSSLGFIFSPRRYDSPNSQMCDLDFVSEGRAWPRT